MGWGWGWPGGSHAKTRDSGAERCVLPLALGKGRPEVGCEDPSFWAVSSEGRQASRRWGWGGIGLGPESRVSPRLLGSGTNVLFTAVSLSLRTVTGTLPSQYIFIKGVRDSVCPLAKSCGHQGPLSQRRPQRYPSPPRVSDRRPCFSSGAEG